MSNRLCIALHVRVFSEKEMMLQEDVTKKNEQGAASETLQVKIASNKELLGVKTEEESVMRLF